MKNFFIGENDFRVWLPEILFDDQIAKSGEEAYNSRKITGIMSTSRKDRQDESVIAKGLDFSEFLHHGHFNDNHSQETSAIVGYPEKTQYHQDLGTVDPKLKGTDGWSCSGYVIKGTKRSDGIWELAKALQEVPNRKLGFSIEGKVIRRKDKTIEKAKIRNVAITNCPVNTDCNWDVMAKSFHDPEEAVKAMMAGAATSPATQTGGGAIRTESLDSDVKKLSEKKKKREEALKRSLNFDELLKAMDFVLEKRPDFNEDAAALFVNHVFKKGENK